MPGSFTPSILGGAKDNRRSQVKSYADTFTPSVLGGKPAKDKDEDGWGTPSTPTTVPKKTTADAIRPIIDLIFNRVPSAVAGAAYESALARKEGMSEWDPRILAPMAGGFKRGITGQERYRLGDYLGEMGVKEGIPRDMADEVFHLMVNPGGLGALKAGGMAVQAGLKSAGKGIATKAGAKKAAQTAAGVGLGGGLYEGFSEYGQGADTPDALKAGATGAAMWGAAELGLGVAGMPVKALFPAATEAVTKGIGGGVLGTGLGTGMGMAQGQDIGEAFVRSGLPVGAMFGGFGALTGRYDPMPTGKTVSKAPPKADWLRDKVAQFRKNDPEYVTELKGAVLEAHRLHRTKVAVTGVRASKWKKNLSEGQLEDVGAYIEGIHNLRTGKSAEAIKSEMGKDPKMIGAKNEYINTMEKMRQEINSYLKGLTEGDYITFVKDYIPHFYRQPGRGGDKELVQRIARWQQNSPNAKARKLPTLKEAVEMGLEPLTQNVAELQQRYAEVNWRVATNRKLLETARTMTNEEGAPIIMKSKDAPADWIRVEHPAFAKMYARKGPDGKTVLYEGKAAVDPEAHKVLRQLIQEPLSNKLVGTVEGFNAYAKKAQLSLSLFHHWALTESAIGALGRKGLFLVGRETKGLGKGIITQPHRVGKKLMGQEKFVEDAVSHGLVLDSVVDAQVGRVKSGLIALEKKLADVPGLGKVARKVRQANDAWDRTLWQNYHSGLKSYTYYDMVGRFAKTLPENATPKDVRVMKEKVAEIINDAYGGQEWTAKWWLSPRAQQAWQALQLAPDWTLSNFSIAAKAFTKAKDPVIGPATRRYWKNMILSQIMVISGANFVLSGGRWPWENEAGHKTEIDVTAAVHALDRAMGRKDANPDQRYYMHPGKQVREVMGWITDPWKTIRGKASPAVHTVMEQTTGHTTTGWDMPWTEDGVEKGFWMSLPDRTKAAAEKFVPFSVGGVGSKTQFAFTFPMRKGMTPWKAHKAYQDVVRMEYDPTFAQKAYGKTFQGVAEDFTGQPLKDRLDNACAANGLDSEKLYKDARTKVTSEYYAKMWDAINRDDMKAAEQAARVLLELGVTPKRLKSSGDNRGLGEEEYEKAADAMRRMHHR